MALFRVVILAQVLPLLSAAHLKGGKSAALVVDPVTHAVHLTVEDNQEDAAISTLLSLQTRKQIVHAVAAVVGGLACERIITVGLLSSDELVGVECDLPEGYLLARAESLPEPIAARTSKPFGTVGRWLIGALSIVILYFGQLWRLKFRHTSSVSSVSTSRDFSVVSLSAQVTTSATLSSLPGESACDSTDSDADASRSDSGFSRTGSDAVSSNQEAPLHSRTPSRKSSLQKYANTSDVEKVSTSPSEASTRSPSSCSSLSQPSTPSSVLASPPPMPRMQDGAVDRAKAKLGQLTKGDTDAAQLERAIAEAREAGVDDTTLLNKADSKLLSINAQDNAQRELHLALKEPAVSGLQSAIAEAEKSNVNINEIQAAKVVLWKEQAKQEAVTKLKQAQDKGDVATLRQAIVEGQRAQVSEEVMKQYEDLLKAMESKVAATKLLQDDIAAWASSDVGGSWFSRTAPKQNDLGTRSVYTLQMHLKSAKEAGVDATLIAKAAEILAVGLAKEEARQVLRHAVKEPSVDGLRKALQVALEKGLTAGPGEPGLQEATELLAQEEKKKAALEKAKKVLEEVKAIASGEDIESLKIGKKKLYAVFVEAKGCGVSEEDLREVEARRKLLHNKIEDLKGSIRVFCRIRPLISKETAQGDFNVARQVDCMTVRVPASVELQQGLASPASPARNLLSPARNLLSPASPTSPTCRSSKDLLRQSSQGLQEKTSKDSGIDFAFDSVFTPGSQEDVFEDCKDLVQSALDGYNVTMFAYGQTGAGKTFTMLGTEENPGTVPRTISELYRLIDENKSRYTITVMASMMELYRNDFVDLLNARSGKEIKKNQQFNVPQESKEAKINIRMDKSNAVIIDNLTEKECPNAEALTKLLDRGNKQRSVAATAMNSESSRSHSLLMIKIVSVNLETQEQIKSKMFLCDLGGSERLKKSEVTGDEQKEAIEINRSLTALGDVIEALTSNKKQIPYRNHKLTMVMQDALGGSSKTLMFVNCSPASSNYDETVNSLKYATRAKKITNDIKKTPHP